MKKIVGYAIPIIFLAAFVWIMNSGDYYKQPRGSTDDFELYLHQLYTSTEKTQWQQAEAAYKNLTRAWEEIEPRIQFSVEQDELHAINIGLVRLKGYLQAGDQKDTLVELHEIRWHWKHLNE
ncbi:MAG TPA: DUF4363 family protein [Syntrophomonadaceae bacterium]|nr:DUF4363 family protein [Syntrophomonadaceae bacterium]